MKNQEKALDRFIVQISEIKERLAELQDFAEEHLHICPDDVNWSNVATAGYYLEQLTELTDHAFGRGEYKE